MKKANNLLFFFVEPLFRNPKREKRKKMKVKLAIKLPKASSQVKFPIAKISDRKNLVLFLHVTRPFTISLVTLKKFMAGLRSMLGLL